MCDYQNLLQHRQAIVAGLVGENVSMSYPVPVTIHDIPLDSYFLYEAGRSQIRRRPFALVRFSAQTSELVSYQNCAVVDFMNPDEHPFTEELFYGLPEEITISEFRQQQAALYSQYNACRNTAFTSGGEQAAKDYWNALLKAVPHALVPFYKQLGEVYIAWMESANSDE